MDYQDEQIIIETVRHRIRGLLHLPREGYRSRLTDYLNSPERRFVPLTDAQVERLDGAGAPEHHPFLVLAVDQIVLALPASGAGESAG